MSITSQDRYSPLVDAKLRASIVQKIGVVWNSRYQGSATAGAVKIPVRDTEVTVSAYDKANGITNTSAAGSFLTLTIDKDYAVSEIIDGYEASAVPDNILADRLDSAGYSLALQENSDATDALLDGGTTSSDVDALTKSNIYGKIVDARTTLSTNKIPTANRFMLVTPTTYALLLKSDEFIRASQLGDAVVQSGIVGQIAGFNVIEDVTLPSDVDFIVGHPDWCARVEEWQTPVTVNDVAHGSGYIGASVVEGRKVYAHKVTKAEAVLIKKNA